MHMLGFRSFLAWLFAVSEPSAIFIDTCTTAGAGNFEKKETE
jgi:hypothetical protein